jgi:RHS repeat-associated protein
MQGAGGVGGILSESSLITSNPITFNSSYPTYDGNGNVSEYLDSTGQVTAHFEYDPFGNTVVNTDTSNQFSYRFSTKPIAFATGLYYYGYRYYDPVTGRWPSRDQIEEEGGLNLYGFVGNDGIGKIDVLGQHALEAAALIALIASEAVKELEKCKGGCINNVDKTEECVGCCNSKALAAQVFLAAAGVAGLAECLVRFPLNPLGYGACALIITYGQSAAANTILTAHNGCTDRCISQGPKP